MILLLCILFHNYFPNEEDDDDNDMDNSETTWKKATKCNKALSSSGFIVYVHFYLIFNN